MQEKIRPVMKYLEDKSLFEYRGGIPTSFQQSAQQWDSRYSKRAFELNIKHSYNVYNSFRFLELISY